MTTHEAHLLALLNTAVDALAVLADSKTVLAASQQLNAPDIDGLLEAVQNIKESMFPTC